MNRFVTTAAIISLSLCGTAFAASPNSNSNSPTWKNGVVREVDNSRQHVSVINSHKFDPGLKGKGSLKQYCTIEVSGRLVVGEREVHEKFDRAKLFVGEGTGVRLEGDTMVVKDQDGNDLHFRVVNTLPDTPQNEPDPTAFAERPIVIQ